MAQKQVKVTEAYDYHECPDEMIHLKVGEERIIPRESYSSHGEQTCVVTFKAPKDHGIQVKCFLFLDKDCERNSFYFANDIHLPFADWEKFCPGSENYFEGTSQFSTIALMLKSNSFMCILDVVPLDTCSCGISTDMSTESLQNASVMAIIKFDSREMTHNTSELICTASIISHSFLLTSATCVSGIPSAKNLAAFSDHNTYENKFTINDRSHWIDEIIIHPDYNPNTKLNDISLLRTAKPLEWSLRTGPICLPGISYEYEFGLKNVSTFEIIGYETDASKLWRQNVEVIPYDDCHDSSLTQMCIKQIKTDQREVCQLGGPILYNDMLVAIRGPTNCESYAPNEQVDIATTIIPQLYWIYRVTETDICIAEVEY